MGGLADAGFWSVAWALVAATAGGGLLLAAIAFGRRFASDDGYEFLTGYNALATQVDR